jgi:formylglycine-generating enzyme required for sulfatase activity
VEALQTVPALAHIGFNPSGARVDSFTRVWGIEDAQLVELGYLFLEIKQPPPVQEGSDDVPGEVASPESGPEQMTNSIGMDLVRIGDGLHTLGCTTNQEQFCRPEEVKYRAGLTNSYWISTTEVTQEQYQAVIGKNPSTLTACGPDCPVDTVTWEDALAYANALSKKEGLTPCRSPGYACNGYRLPTETEWEIAARGQGSTDFVYAGSDDSDLVAWTRENSDGTSHPVAQKEPNYYGLYDMSGNAWEWVWDRYGDRKATKRSETYSDYLGPDKGDARVSKGGGWYYPEMMSRIPARGANVTYRKHKSIGFRVVRTIDAPTG